ncbi:MAG TPA: DNA-binding protein [Nitrospirae bacterium]|nr:DNA-binding protein [Nitrospirota bacterium]
MNLLTVKEIARILKIKLSTVYAWAEQGTIPCFKINGALRFDHDEIDRWLASCKRRSYNEVTGKRPGKGGQI